MMVVRIRAELANGEVYVGPIMGNGGMIGSASLFTGYPNHAESAALDILRIARLRATKGRALPIFEPKPGYVAIYPDFCAATDGERIDIPIDGTIFSIEVTS